MRAVIALILALVLGGCGDEDTFSPTVETVAGSYTAISLTASSSVGTTSGRLFVPGGAEDGGDLDVDLTGTWTLSGTTVRFDQEGDSFIPDVAFTAGRNQLNGEGTFSGTIIRLVLGKMD
jgi:hypothetical protein